MADRCKLSANVSLLIAHISKNILTNSMSRPMPTLTNCPRKACNNMPTFTNAPKTIPMPSNI